MAGNETRDDRQMTKTIAIVAVLSACVPPPPRGTTQPSPTPAAPQDDMIMVSPLQRTDRVREEVSTAGLAVIAEPYGAAAFTLQIRNDGVGAASVLWDESTMVSAQGEVIGKLVRGETKRMDVANAQPPTAIPRGAHITQDVFLAGLYAVEETEITAAKFQRDHGGMPSKMRDMLLESRAIRDKILRGARLHVVIEIGGEKRTWTGVIE